MCQGRRAFVETFVKEIVVMPGKAVIQYRIPMPDDSHTPGTDSVSIVRVYRPVVARVIEPPCGPVDGLLSPLGLRVNHLLSVEQGPVG